MHGNFMVILGAIVLSAVFGLTVGTFFKEYNK
jgi:ABC-type phosphate transport system permease subunit